MLRGDFGTSIRSDIPVTELLGERVVLTLQLAGLAFVITVVSAVPLGVAAGLFVGKQVGVLGAVWGAARLGIARPPGGASWPQVYGTALLCGIGFTMSLFIAGLAFADADLVDEVKVGILTGSLLSACAGYGVLRLCGSRSRQVEA